VFLVVPATILSATLGSLNGYVLSKLRFRGSNVVFTLLLFGMFIPYQSILIPLVQFLETINLYGGIPGLILVHVVYGIPICTLIFRNYFATVLADLLEPAVTAAPAGTAFSGTAWFRFPFQALWSSLSGRS